MKNKLLSIIVPVYNVENYLEQCLNSIITYNPTIVEIILINDGSTDNSLNICKRYENEYSNITVISQINSGLSEARNTGIRNATGKYLMFLDSDDYVHEDSLKQIFRDLKNEDKDILLGRAFQFEDGCNNLVLQQTDYDLIKYHNPIDCLSKLNDINQFWFAAWLLIAKREFIISESLFFKKGILHEDELWVPSVFAKATNVKLLNYGFYCYRTNRAGSIVSKPNIKREFDKFIIVDELDAILKKYPNSEQLLSSRQSALVFGILLSLNSFKNNHQYNNLQKQLISNINHLKNSKYSIVYYLYRIIGLELTARLISLLTK